MTPAANLSAPNRQHIVDLADRLAVTFAARARARYAQPSSCNCSSSRP